MLEDHLTEGRMYEDYEQKQGQLNPCRSDPVIERVRRDLHDRSQLGIQKYGTTLAENDAAHFARLRHAYEEALDLANYLMWAMMQIEARRMQGQMDVPYVAGTLSSP